MSIKIVPINKGEALELLEFEVSNEWKKGMDKSSNENLDNSKASKDANSYFTVVK